MEDKTKITEEQAEEVNGGGIGWAIPDKKVVCPNCGSEEVIFDKSEYIPHKGQWTYYFWCRDCSHHFHFQEN